MNVKTLSIFEKIYKVQQVDLFDDKEIKNPEFPYVKPMVGYTYKTIEVTSIEAVNSVNGKMIKINGDNEYLFPVINTNNDIKLNENWFNNETDVNNLVTAFNKLEEERMNAMIAELQRKVKVLNDLTERSIHVKK